MMFPNSAILTRLLLLAALVNWSKACTDKVYVGTVEGQLSISEDGGNTWGLMFGVLPTIWAVSASGEHAYAATDYGLGVESRRGAMWSIKDLQVTSGCDSSVQDVFVDNETRVYALIGYDGRCGLVAVSSDNGNTWTNVMLPDPFLAQFSYLRNIYVDGPRIYVVTYYGLGYTDDMGATWTVMNQSSGLGDGRVHCVIGNGQTIYAGLNEDGAPVSASLDDGQTWKTVNTTPTGSVSSMYLQGDTLYVATLGGGLSWSSDFTTWTRKTTADGLASNFIFSIIGSGNNLYLGTDSGLSISHDRGQTWITKTTKDGLPSNNIYTVFAQCV